jgi:hypothetical protein
LTLAQLEPTVLMVQKATKETLAQPAQKVTKAILVHKVLRDLKVTLVQPAQLAQTVLTEQKATKETLAQLVLTELMVPMEQKATKAILELKVHKD